ncbi:MAG: hypothetical protein QOI36_1823 [Pseudonocardiales bacterium]|nr:hypothetical protein [Pseudonocardiales bacterium]
MWRWAAVDPSGQRLGARPGRDPTAVRIPGLRSLGHADRVVYGCRRRRRSDHGQPARRAAHNDQSDLRVVLWLHGTTVYRGDVASMKADSTDRAVALLLASAGGAVSAPDCIGLGEGPGTHPYGHPGATLSASLDALRAARDVARQQGRTIDERVQISGFSQGGPAATMVGRAVQEGADPDFSPGGLTPIGGPFDLSGFEAAAANDDNL